MFFFLLFPDLELSRVAIENCVFFKLKYIELDCPIQNFLFEKENVYILHLCPEIF
jgi:hypothetical protein